MGKWADLPIDLIEFVDKYLDFVEKIRICAACTSWNSYLPAVPKLISDELPCLIIEDSTKGASLYSVHEAKLFPLNLPELKHKIFKGSSYGWIITLEDENSSHIDEIYAFNPLTRVRIKLPPRSAFPDIIDVNPLRVGQEYFMKDPDYQQEPEIEPEQQELEPVLGQDRAGYFVSNMCVNQIHIKKVVLSSSPSNDDCIAVAMYGEFCQLAWCRPHHKQWTSFVEYCGTGPHTGVWDVLFDKGKLYVLYSTKNLEIYDGIDPNIIVRQVVTLHDDLPMMMSTPSYLIVCPNLGIIVASQEIHMSVVDGVVIVDTSWIHVFKLVESSKTWVEMEGLGENILFLGLNMPSLIPVSDDFKALGYKRNCIYYTDNFAFFTGRHENQDDSDMGVMDLDDLFKDALPGFIDEPQFFWPPPIWVTPSAN